MNVRLACFDWVWDHCQNNILENNLLRYTHDYIITSMIDADDTVNRLVADQLLDIRESTQNRGTLLTHSSGLAITFPHGYAGLSPIIKSGRSNKSFAAWPFL